MTVAEAVETLADDLSRFRWFVSIGVGTPNDIETIYVYVTSLRHPELTALRNGYHGIPVIIENSGAFRPSVPNTNASGR